MISLATVQWIDPMKRKALKSHPTHEAAIAWAERYRNVAFVWGERILTCTRSYVCDLVNLHGEGISVLADHEFD